MSNARDKEMSTGLLRQRRNVMAISIILPLYLFSGATFQNINILGTPVLIENPKLITIFLILLFFYFLLRYWQYFNEENHVKDAKEDLKVVQQPYVERYIERKLDKKFNGVIRDKINAYDIVRFFIQFRNNAGIDEKEIKKGFLSRTVPVNISVHVDKQNAIKLPFVDSDEKNNIQKIIENDKSWKPKKSTKNRVDRYQYYQTTLSLSTFQLLYQKAKGFMRFIFTETIFTDYYLPFLVWSTSFIFLVVWGASQMKI